MHFIRLYLVSTLAFVLSSSALAMGQHHGHKESSEQGLQSADTRIVVGFPKPVYDHTLQSMRSHLEAIDQVIARIAEQDFEGAALAVDRGLGIGHQHGADGLRSGRAFMPEGMRSLGHQMHMRARDLAVTLRDATVTSDTTAVLRALGAVTTTCTTCHQAYRLEPKSP